MQASLLLTGISLDTDLFAEFLTTQPSVAWIEVCSDNYLTESDQAFQQLEKIRQNYPVSLHGNGLSPGSCDEINWHYLKQLKELSQRIDACLVSDHLSWSSFNGQYFHDHFPLPYTEESLTLLINKINQVQDFLQRQILLENIPHYLNIEDNQMTEACFLNNLASETGCGLLVDINALYVSSHNTGMNTKTYLQTLPKDAVQELHVSGFSATSLNGDDVLLASKNRAIVPAIWELYKLAVTTLGHKPCIVEWLEQQPAMDTLCLEAFRAETMLREAYATTKRTG